MKRLDKNILAARMGLEKESLRVDRRARLAQTSNPYPDEADLENARAAVKKFLEKL